jgi:hypothetical protein
MGFRGVRCRLRQYNHGGDCDDDDEGEDVYIVIMVKEQYLRDMWAGWLSLYSD